MNVPFKTRRRLFIGLGLLGIAGVLYRPVYRYLEERSMRQEWEADWRKARRDAQGTEPSPTPEHAGVLPARIDRDLTLKAAHAPWLVDRNITIPAGVTLTLEAGCEILIGKYNYFEVSGRIVAQGEAGNPVRLRAYSIAGSDMSAGMLIIDSDMPSVFRHVAFENSYYGARVVRATAHWQGCTFINVREICSGYKSDTRFHDCIIDYRNFPGGGNINVFKFHKGWAHMEGCSIQCPDSDYKVDGVDADYMIEGVFRGNRLYGGACPGADAFDIGRGSRNVLLEDNIISDFVDKGISVGEGAELTARNNVISGCAMGIGVKDRALARVTRTTFYGNDYAARCYEKVAGQGGGHAELEDCIIADCKIAPYMIADNSSISFTRTLCDQQLLPGENNLQGTPDFEDVAGGLFNCTGITMADGTTRECGMLGANMEPHHTGSRAGRQTAGSMKS
jgi:hypothetical protein